MYRSIEVITSNLAWINGRFIPKTPISCFISRRGRMHNKYHRDVTAASASRLYRYIENSMIETNRAHSHAIKYETRLDKIPRKQTIKLLKADDWEALILDERMLAEGHRFHTNEILEIIADMGLIEYVYEDHYDDADEGYFEDILKKYREIKDENY